jgi:LacI family transcriptional regulator
MMSMGALLALHEAGIRVPEDISLIAVGDPPYLAYAIPPLTTLALPIEEAGRRAAQLLLTWIRGNPPATKQTIVLPYEMRLRESCRSINT